MKVNVCIDGNYLFHKTFGIYRGFGKKKKNPQDIFLNEKRKKEFAQKISTDLSYSLKSITFNGKVILVLDKKSWRKKYYTEYKNNRVKDKEEDWSLFFDFIIEYSAILEGKGFIISSCDGAEGDDLIFRWCNKFRSLNESTVIISGDRDLSQLVSVYNSNFIVLWDNNSKNLNLFSSRGWKLNMEITKESSSNSLFDLDFESNNIKKSLIELANTCDLREIKGDDIVFEKILSGDDGDNIPSVWEKYNSRGTGKIRITGKKTENITKLYNNRYDINIYDLFYDEERLFFLAGLILRSLKDIDGKEERNLVIENIQRNIKLIWLSDKCIPAELIEKMDIQINNKLRENKYSTINISSRKDILNNTKYSFDDNHTPDSFDVLKYIS